VVARNWKRDMRTAGKYADDPALRARRRVERAIKSRNPSTWKGKLLVAVGPIVVGCIVEHGARVLEERAPELPARGVEKAKEGLPLVGKGVRAGVKRTRERIQARRNKSAGGPR